MRILFALLALLVLFQPATSQTVDDSISVILGSGDADTTKVMRLLSLFHEYKHVSPEQAYKASESALKLAEEKNLEYYQARALSFMGIARYSMDRYTEALELYLNAMKLYDKLGKKREQAVVLTNLGNIFLDQELPDRALPYYRHALAIDRELKLERDIAMDLMNISSAYSISSRIENGFNANLDSAMDLCNEAIQLAKALQDTLIYAQALANLGIIEYEKAKNDSLHVSRDKYDSALRHALEAEALFSKAELESNKGVLYLAIGDIYLKRDEISKARGYYTLALENARALESIDDERWAYYGLSKCAELSGNISEAYKFLTKYSNLNDTIFNIRSSRKQTQLLVDYEIQKKEAKLISDQEKRDAIHLGELARQRTQKNIFIVGFSVVFVLSFIMLRLYRQKNKANKDLKDAVKNLEETQSQLIHQEKMASLGMLSAGIAHEIQNPLNFVTNFSDSSIDLIREINETTDDAERNELMKELAMNVEKISHHGKRADSIIKSMLRHSHGGQEEKKPTNLNKLCDEFLMLAYHSMRANSTDFNCAIEKNFQPDMPKVNLMTQEVTRVMLNLFTNAFHAMNERLTKQPGFSPVISVTTKMDGNTAKVIIRDNGVGIPVAIREKIFQPFFTTKKSGEGTGLGLSISYDIIKAHGGELKVDSKEGEFTEFTVEFPA